MESVDVVIVGGGVSGLTAGVFTARANLQTVIVNSGTSILNRNAHLENFPGFPAGLSPRLFLEMLESQFEDTGGRIQRGRVETLKRSDNGFDLRYRGRTLRGSQVICASWSDVSYLAGTDVEIREDDGKTFIKTDRWGRTSVPGIYGAGRVSGEYHQAIIAAGSGATSALTVLEDRDNDFYHDWVAPDGYFTNRDREVPEGCVEIPNEERKRRSRRSQAVLEEFVQSHQLESPEPHSSQETAN